jgi:predicted phage-related endonuclease
MKIKTFKTEDEWLEARSGRITGTKLGGLVSKRNGEKKIGFYSLIAERIAIPASEENVMDRGHRLEDEAVELFKKRTGKKVKNELVIWYRDDDENIAYSPDGSIGKSQTVEIKCLSTARHLEAYITKKVPDDYEHQVIQSFIVNTSQKKLWFVMYDPRCPIDLFWFEITRKEKEQDIADYLKLEQEVLKEVADWENKILNY